MSGSRTLAGKKNKSGAAAYVLDWGAEGRGGEGGRGEGGGEKRKKREKGREERDGGMAGQVHPHAWG